jgi:hypothetical protein
MLILNFSFINLSISFCFCFLSKFFFSFQVFLPCFEVFLDYLKWLIFKISESFHQIMANLSNFSIFFSSSVLKSSLFRFSFLLNVDFHIFPIYFAIWEKNKNHPVSWSVLADVWRRNHHGSKMLIAMFLKSIDSDHIFYKNKISWISPKISKRFKLRNPFPWREQTKFSHELKLKSSLNENHRSKIKYQKFNQFF